MQYSVVLKSAVNSHPFTIGKIYDVVDGVIIDDYGGMFDTWGDESCGYIGGDTFENLYDWFYNTSNKMEFELLSDCSEGIELSDISEEEFFNAL